MECVPTGECPYITNTLQKVIDDAPWGIKKNEARRKQNDAIEKLSCGETIGKSVCCAMEERSGNDEFLFNMY